MVIDPINDISLTDKSVNFMQTRRGDGKFNSTMKNSHQNYSPGNKQGNYSNYNNPDNDNPDNPCHNVHYKDSDHPE